MLWSWVRGIRERGGTPEATGPLTRALAEAGMAEPGKGPAKTVIGKSELMGKGRPF